MLDPLSIFLLRRKIKTFFTILQDDLFLIIDKHQIDKQYLFDLTFIDVQNKSTPHLRLSF